MNIFAIIAKIVIVIFYLCVLMLASNQHGKAWKGSVNFWVVLAAVTANFVMLSVGGFFDGLVNLGL
jgi:hypothetical protein